MGRLDGVGRLVGMLVIAGLLSPAAGCSASEEPTPSSISTPQPTASIQGEPTASPTAGAILTVTVHDVVGLADGWLAGVLYEGDEMIEANAVGGFGTRIDSDPFSTTKTVNTPYLFAPVFPNVSDEPLLLAPGTHILFVWADEDELIPYARWAPDGSYMCAVVFGVDESDVTLSISGVPPVPTAIGPRPTPCVLD